MEQNYELWIIIGVLLLFAIVAFFIAIVRGGGCNKEDEARDIPGVDDVIEYCERPFNPY